MDKTWFSILRSKLESYLILWDNKYPIMNRNIQPEWQSKTIRFSYDLMLV